ncbi:spermidine/putrescine ABC transporter ATP-binding protein [Acetobacter indonesiensis]|uniref:ABC transporter ATP-binding protein n=1 Tax=Acetobacter indonesiensis TaxID=104101 RepID=UPI000A3B195B|nr:ABC transporter ATP-binding protein [Acetobacter indonesiensis]OUI94960.1 spermidine/putrescine ABC transporter ATP-binding protein [Acetobacter indonesiensis]
MHTAHGSPPPLALFNFTPLPSGAPLTLTVPSGQCLALLGIGNDQENFTTLCAALAGHRHPVAGSLHVAGMDVTHTPTGHRRLGTIGQHTPLFPHLTVTENVLFPLRAEGRIPPADCQRRVTETLALTGLEALRNHRPARLTDEQVFRAQLARVLVTRPEVIVLDRPFTTLQPASISRLVALIEKLQRAIGLSTLLLTANRAEALLLGDRIGILENGQLLQCDTVPTLLDRPVCEQVAVAFGEANALTGKVLYCDDDTAELRLPSGETVEAMAAAGLEDNDLARICIPPDRLSVLFPRSLPVATEDSEGMLLCALVSARHLGTSIHMRFRMQDGAELIAHRPPVHLPKDLQPGRPALLAWQTASATAFPMDEKSG